MPIKLKINLPDCTLADVRADKIVLPISGGTLTVIEERAPTMQLLTAGIVALLDENNQQTQRWFINGGLADIASDCCKIAVEEAVDLNCCSLDFVEAKSQENVFYKKIYQYLKAFG